MMELSEKEIIIVDMIHTIQGLNNLVGFQVPLKEAIDVFLKSSGRYYELKEEYGNQLIELTEQDIFENAFEKKVKNLEELITHLENRIRFRLPLSVEYDSEYNFQEEEIINEDVTELLDTLKGISENRKDKQIYLFSLNEKNRAELVEDLIELGKVRLKFELMNKAKKEILIYGYFKVLEFEDVPTACRYYAGDSKLVNKDQLKSFLKHSTILGKKKNTVLDNKTKNSGMHSWIQGENKKTNNKIEFYAQENSSQK